MDPVSNCPAWKRLYLECTGLDKPNLGWTNLRKCKPYCKALGENEPIFRRNQLLFLKT